MDPFDVLGIPRRFGLSRAELEQRHRDLSRTVHPDRYVSAPPQERRMALERAIALNDAFRTVRDPLTRSEALLALHGVSIAEADRASPALLMDIMELREALDDARDPARIEALRTSVDERMHAAEAVLASVFDGNVTPDATQLSQARDALITLRYLKRFQEEADARLGT